MVIKAIKIMPFINKMKRAAVISVHEMQPELGFVLKMYISWHRTHFEGEILTLSNNDLHCVTVVWRSQQSH